MSGKDIRALTMPKFGLTMTEGKVAKWSASVGDSLSKGDEVADIETDKITNALEAPVAGLLRRQVADEGTTLPVGALIGVIADGDVSDDKIDAFVSGFEPEQMS
jgi:pyruvate dehydrogenase E2 component (dihydrolipoamide acetyltransferase)